MRVAALALTAMATLAGPAAAQDAVSPFVGHWVGEKKCDSGTAAVVLDIEAPSDNSVVLTMRAEGVGTLSDGSLHGDRITLTWSNFLSHVTFEGRFVSAERVEGRYHESLTGEDCTWYAQNQSAAPAATSAETSVQPAAVPPPATSAPSAAPAPAAPTEQDLWKKQADDDREKLKRRLGPTSRDDAIRQFCQFSPDQAGCAARIGRAYDFLVQSAFATLIIASKNRQVPLPPTEPAHGLPSYVDVYQVFMFLTRE